MPELETLDSKFSLSAPRCPATVAKDDPPDPKRCPHHGADGASRVKGEWWRADGQSKRLVVQSNPGEVWGARARPRTAHSEHLRLPHQTVMREFRIPAFAAKAGGE